MHHLAWAPTLLIGALIASGGHGSVAVLAAGGHVSIEALAAIVGALATLISAVTGLIIALKRSPQIIVVTPEEAEQIEHLRKAAGQPEAPKRRHKRRDP